MVERTLGFLFTVTSGALSPTFPIIPAFFKALPYLSISSRDFLYLGSTFGKSVSISPVIPTSIIHVLLQIASNCFFTSLSFAIASACSTSSLIPIFSFARATTLSRISSVESVALPTISARAMATACFWASVRFLKSHPKPFSFSFIDFMALSRSSTITL